MAKISQRRLKRNESYPQLVGYLGTIMISPEKYVKKLFKTYFVFLTGCKFETSSCFCCCILSVFNPKCFELSFFLIFFQIFSGPILPKTQNSFDFDSGPDFFSISEALKLKLDHIVDLRLVYQYLFKAKVICSLTSDSIILVLEKKLLCNNDKKS